MKKSLLKSYIVVPKEGLPTAFIFVIDAGRVADETWLPEENVMAFAPMGGMDQISIISSFINDECLKGKEGVVGVEAGMGCYLPEGNMTYYEYQRFEQELAPSKLVNALDL
ncbi:MAG: aminopeptidase P family protein, partial [Clostridiales bacterium]|nr:aminopeptidase P family protein [Clostridiales bacterium]